jgi:hypothetical protein
MPSPLSSYNVPNTPSGHNRPTVLQEGLGYRLVGLPIPPDKLLMGVWW